MSTPRVRSSKPAADRTVIRTSRSRRTAAARSSLAAQSASEETFADVAIVLRKAIEHKVNALTGHTTQRILDARHVVLDRADEARRVLTQSVKQVEARFKRVKQAMGKRSELPSVREAAVAAEAVVKRVARKAKAELAAATQTKPVKAPIRGRAKSVAKRATPVAKSVATKASVAAKKVRAAAA